MAGLLQWKVRGLKEILKCCDFYEIGITLRLWLVSWCFKPSQSQRIYYIWAVQRVAVQECHLRKDEVVNLMVSWYY